VTSSPAAVRAQCSTSESECTLYMGYSCDWCVYPNSDIYICADWGWNSRADCANVCTLKGWSHALLITWTSSEAEFKNMSENGCACNNTESGTVHYRE
jgi:hypothetical protein